MNKPKCEECNTVLEIDEIVNVSGDIENAECDIIGYCPECGKRYTWTGIYIFAQYKDLTEDE